MVHTAITSIHTQIRASHQDPPISLPLMFLAPITRYAHTHSPFLAPPPNTPPPRSVKAVPADGTLASHRVSASSANQVRQLVPRCPYLVPLSPLLLSDANSPGVAPLTWVLGRPAPPVPLGTRTRPSSLPTQAYRTGGRCPKSSSAHPAWAATAWVASRAA